MDKGIMKKILKRWTIMAIVVIILLIFSGALFTKKQIMNNLDYNITLNDDGSVTIVENWDIHISHTNTLFRTFIKSSKFGDIINVNVKDLDTGEDLTQIYREMYHVTTDCFYALNLNPREFEVAWGTGMENKIGRKKYQFSYTITDVVSDYKDCQEFYWQLLDKSNSIPVKKVTGTITIPKKVENKDNLKVWGHGPLNGKIQVESKDTVKFLVDELDKNRMLEVRLVTTEKVIDTKNQKNYRYLEQIINQESKWANESNNIASGFYKIIISIYVISIIFNIYKAIKLYKISKKKNDGLIYTNLKYFRDIPREDISTPAEAAYLYMFDKSRETLESYQGNIVAATILDLALKGYIKLEVEDKKTYVQILKEGNGLNDDEFAVYKILKETGGKSRFEIGEINYFAKEKYSRYSTLINKLINEARESIYRQKLVDKANRKLYQKAERAKNNYNLILRIIEFILVGFVIGLIPIFEKAYIYVFGVGFKYNFITLLAILLPLIITILIKLKINWKAKDKIAVLTQKGIEEQEQWKALVRYIKDFSMIEEQKIPSLAIWEKYLVYATVFGMADEAIEQMKAKYPEVFVEEYWKDETLNQYQIINFAANNIIYNIRGESTISSITSDTNRAYSTSLSEIARHSSSSGSGGGGGFSGGGGGRWWWRPEWVGR